MSRPLEDALFHFATGSKIIGELTSAPMNTEERAELLEFLRGLRPIIAALLEHTDNMLTRREL